MGEGRDVLAPAGTEQGRDVLAPLGVSPPSGAKKRRLEDGGDDDEGEGDGGEGDGGAGERGETEVEAEVGAIGGGLVELDGDEMTRIIWTFIKDKNAPRIALTSV